jgi:hypothetical protein
MLYVDGCLTGIPVRYTVNNLPLDTPEVYFETSMNSFTVP